MNTVEKRCEARHSKFFARFDRKVAEGRLNDVIDSSLGYAFMYYHTADGDMYKEWMKEKRTKKDFRLNNDDDNRLWVRLPDGKSDEEVEPINLVFDETNEFNEVLKKFIINGMREYNQCFITIMAYNLMLTHDGDPKILNLTDDRLDTSASFAEIASMSGSRSIGSGTEMPWRYRRQREAVLSTSVGSAFMSRCSLSAHSWATNSTHLLSLDRRRSTRTSMTTDACNGASFWQVKADTGLLQIAR